MEAVVCCSSPHNAIAVDVGVAVGVAVGVGLAESAGADSQL